MTSFGVTWWRDTKGQGKDYVDTSWPMFVERLWEIEGHDKNSAPLIKLAKFGDARTVKGSLRHDANVEAITGIEGDYDGGEVPPEEALHRLEKYHIKAVIVTTHSHRRDSPRWRVLAPLSKEYPPTERRRFIAALNGMLGGVLNRESFTLSQSFFVGPSLDPSTEYKVLVPFDDINEGRFLDDLEPIELDEVAIYPNEDGERASIGEHLPPPPGSGLPDLVKTFLEHIEPDDYLDWIRVGAALHYCDPSGGLEMWDEWSSRSAKYKGRKEVEEKWETFNSNRERTATAAALVQMARSNGYTGPAYSVQEIRAKVEDGKRIADKIMQSTKKPEDPSTFVLLRELLDRPELLLPPASVIPRLAWRGRTTGLVGPDKSGKSTLSGHAVAALTTKGHWLGETMEKGRAVIVAPDEAVGDTVRRLNEAGAHPDRTQILILRPPDLLRELNALLTEWPADLIIVDSLAEWARMMLGRAPEDGDSSGWGAVVRPLVQVSRDHDCATILLHHPRRSDGQYRGSGEIAAAVDCLLEITMPQNGEDPTLRRFRGRARWPLEEFSLRLHENEYVMGGGGLLSIEARILMDLAVYPGTSRNQQHDRIGGNRSKYLASINIMMDAGMVIERGQKLYRSEDVEREVL